MRQHELEAFRTFWDPEDDFLMLARGCSAPTFRGSAAELTGIASSIVSLFSGLARDAVAALNEHLEQTTRGSWPRSQERPTCSTRCCPSGWQPPESSSRPSSPSRPSLAERARLLLTADPSLPALEALVQRIDLPADGHQ